MELSSKVRYALLALLELASSYEQGDFLQIDQIAATHRIPERYLAQLLMALRRCGLVRSQRGAKGGYVLAKEPGQITVREVLVCLEGINSLEPTGQTTTATPASTVIEEVWQEASTAAIAVLQRYTLQDLCQKRDGSHMYYI
jgi:Rrf2 family transcriptional regulator, cysteine metabolism repressor